jgi:hypothetical protein
VATHQPILLPGATTLAIDAFAASSGDQMTV